MGLYINWYEKCLNLIYWKESWSLIKINKLWNLHLVTSWYDPVGSNNRINVDTMPDN